MKRRVLTALSIAAVGTAVFSGCAIANVVSPPFAAAIYATPADAAGAASSVAIPSWVPADATNIRIKTDESKNATIMMFTPGGTVPAYTACDAASDPQVDQAYSSGAIMAQLNETWWPQALDQGAGVACNGAWHLFGQEGHYYAWTP